jgi:hypothetical protein
VEGRHRAQRCAYEAATVAGATPAGLPLCKCF